MAGLSITDVNLSGTVIQNANFTEVQISDCRLTGSTINGIPVSDLLAAYQSLGKNGK